MTAIFELSNIYKSYGPIPVLKNLSLAIEPGETVAVIGPNGAGKTTMFRVATGEVRPTTGSIHYRGSEITAMPAHKRIGLGIGRSFQVARVFPEFTVAENMVVAIESRKDSKRRPWFAIAPHPAVRQEALDRLAQIGLDGKADILARFMSHGDKKRLEFALTFARSPRIVMLDEPTAGMSPSDRHQTIEFLKSTFTREKLTILLTEHDMDVVFKLADRILVLNYGELVAAGTPEEIRDNEDVRNVYLGNEIEYA